MKDTPYLLRGGIWERETDRINSGRYESLVRRLVKGMEKAAQDRDKNKYLTIEKRLLRLQDALGGKLADSPKMPKGYVWDREVNKRKQSQYQKAREKLVSELRKAGMSGDREKYDRLVNGLSKLDEKFGKKGEKGIGEPKEELWNRLRKLSEMAPSGKRGGGQSLEGSNLDTALLKERVREWRKDLKLPDVPGIDAHDSAHILVRDYLGKTSEQISRFLGLKGRGPSVLEEILVGVFESEIIAYRNGRVKFDKSNEARLRDVIDRFILISKNMGFVPPKHTLSRNKDRITNTLVKYFNAVSNRPDFDQFLDTLDQARNTM